MVRDERRAICPLHCTVAKSVFFLLFLDEESPGLYGFLHVIVHSATGFKESASKSSLFQAAVEAANIPFLLVSAVLVC